MPGTMRLTRLLVLTAATLALAACGQEESSSKGAGAESGASPAQTEAAKSASRRIVKHYQVKSGMVEYALTGTRSGTETLYWDDWGEREARYTKASISMMGMTQTTDDWVITLPDVVYSIDMKTKTGVKSGNPAKAFAAGLSDKELEDFGRRMAESMGAKMVGTDRVAGLSCELWRTEQMQSESCDHKGVPLRMVSNTMGMNMTVTATKVDLGADVDESHFTVPADVTVSEAPALPPGFMGAGKGGMMAPGDNQ